MQILEQANTAKNWKKVLAGENDHDKDNDTEDDEDNEDGDNNKENDLGINCLFLLQHLLLPILFFLFAVIYLVSNLFPQKYEYKTINFGSLRQL
jgi:hypothetical protein